ncbi:Listeria/Bacterioides repeat-containing protein [Ruminococcaceae bacterium YAD3003]|nr:Listeria/Bacterioides repeat-containing protein [Ruminococcaceae bacterium YAD3003]
MKKVLAALLATVMVVALMPMTVLADDPKYTVKVTANDPTKGSVYLDDDQNKTEGEYVENASVTVHAEAASGYELIRFEENGIPQSVYSTSGTYDLSTINKNHTVKAVFAKTYTFIAYPFDENMGDVEVSNEFFYDQQNNALKAAENDTVTLTAIPKEGYTFAGWKTSEADESYVSTDESVDINVTDSFTYIAYFSVIQYNVTVSANPSEGGTATGGAIVDYNGSTTIKAMPNLGYEFVNWTIGDPTGPVLSTQKEFDFNSIKGNYDLIANFEKIKYAVVATSNDTSLGTVTLSETSPVEHGKTITITATPANNCHLDKWTENGTAVDPSKYTINADGSSTFTFEVTSEHTAIQAVFRDKYTVNIVAEPTEGGSVTGASSGEVTPNQEITLTAVPKTTDGYHFVKWSDNDQDVDASKLTTDSNGNSVYKFNVNEDHKVVAIFALNEYNVTAIVDPTTPNSSGTIERNKTTYYHGDTVVLTAKPATGFEFVEWTDGGQAVDASKVSTDANGNSVYTFTITEDHDNIVAVFKLKSYTITVNAGTGGTVVGPTAPVNHFEEITVTATPATGYSFVSWTENGSVKSTDAAYTFTVTGTCNLVANFSINQYAITLTDDGNGTTSGAGTYNHFADATVHASPNTGYHFDNWTENGSVIDGADADYNFRVYGPRTLKANFEINSYSINVTSDGHGAVEGGNTYNHFAIATVKATPDTGYSFAYWSENGTAVSYDAEYSFEVGGPHNLVANFVINTYVIAVTAGDHGSATTSGTYEHFKSITLTATPDTGYHFVSWTENGNVVSTSPSYTFTVTGARDLTANFAINYYTVKYVNDDGTVLQESQFSYGSNAYYQQQTTPTKKPTAQFTYTFAGWDNKVTLVTDDVTYTATYDYTINKYKITFANEDGSVLQTGELEYGKMPVYEKDTPTKASTVQETFTFAGWDKEITKVTGETVYTATYTAKAITKDDVNYKHFTVTFESNGGSEVVSQLVVDGGVAFKPEEPMRERYTFGGWYIDAALTKPFSFATVITSDITLYAKWIKGSQDVDATYAIVGSGSMSWSTGSGEDITVAVERSKDNDSIATHFKGVQIDGAELEYYNYELTDDNSGVIIRADALEGLAVGSHTITILYDDGKAEVELVIADANKPAETVEETTATEAGVGEIVNITTEKSSYLGLWIALAIVAGVVIAAFPIFIIKRRSLK